MILSFFAGALAAAGISSCGGDSVRNSDRRDAVVSRVGDIAITKPTFAHWMTVLAPQHVVPDPPRYAACIARQQAFAPQATGGGLKERCRQRYQALRQRVLDFLISSRWLIDEAADQGMTVSQQDVNQRLAAKRESFASAAEFQESLKAIAHTIADVKLEIQAELATERIRRRLSQGEARVTRSEIVDYYQRHIGSYHLPERRYFDIGENFPSAAVARSKMSDVRAGRESLHESLPRKSFTDYEGEKRIIYEAIFKAKPHVVSAPIRLNNLYFLIDVTRITPPYVQSLAQVQRTIGDRLSSERARRTLAAFIAAWRSRWIARTDCDVGYVVQKCRQYSGPKAPEDPLHLT
jgi:parvulin-like peptidyl-prolyl isomerase